MTIAFLGPAATFTDLAVRKAFPTEDRTPCLTIPRCMDLVVAGEVDLAVVPLENALEGTVNLTIDYLYHEANLTIIGEIIAPIQQHLMVHPDHAKRWKEVEKILSHPHAIAQCHKFLHNQFPHTRCEQSTSTAAAAQFISEHPEYRYAAIGNALSAESYQLVIAKENIHDYTFNHTRFIILSKGENRQIDLPLKKTQDKTTIMVTLPTDNPGALHQVLSAFAWRHINLSKIESRPLKTGLGNYFFIIDIGQKMDEVLLPSAFKEMEALGCKVTVIGSYSSYLI
ncbi:prephenate dehydratase [Oikeobacillus pervagus]|uniref:Prephenate dehydratase n=1 Tax=Oikeobacillus pervagus TaxID=1325931 RepID=A0AAJ1SXE2_9BACI|nr:prephenate dehydratase [Oikeobacillus pervagus]MDQ0214568.1 prephenate dehydratase [Oikeobacillus pervagus]